MKLKKIHKIIIDLIITILAVILLCKFGFKGDSERIKSFLTFFALCFIFGVIKAFRDHAKSIK